MSSEHKNNKNSNLRQFPELPPGTLISHYKIVKKLGFGGMGGVYLAEDTKLSRQVALKFLPVSLSNKPRARENLLREARAASKLSHQNIVSIYAIEEIDNRIFIVMEYIEGQPLTELIASKELALNRVMSLALQIAEGLAAAHEAGIVHCDIKPDNIAVTSKGLIKIMDFGIARLKDSTYADQSDLSSGTLFYMSPEQVRGDKIDYRTDIFSFGTILYELLTGKRPFTGEYEAAITYSILNETPESISKLRSHVPDLLQKIVSKSIEKNPDNRYQSANEIIAELKEFPVDDKAFGSQPKKTIKTNKLILLGLLASLLVIVCFLVFYVIPHRESELVSKRNTLAVLPLQNLGSPGDEYFAEGVTDAIITHLAKSRNLGVISRSSVMQYKQSEKNLRQISSELGVDYIIEGTVNWDKSSQISKVKVNVKLILTKDDTHIWAESYERELEKIFVIQTDIAHEVSKALNIALAEPAHGSLEIEPTDNLQAYDFYLRGNMYFYRYQGWEEKDLRIAINMYENAVALDSNFALALAMLSRAHSGMYWDYYDRSDKRIEDAKKAVDKAIAIDPNLPPAHLAMGVYFYSLMNYQKALEQFMIALKSQPNNSELIAAIAGVQRRQGQLDQAIINYIKAFELDPRSNIRAFDVGLAYGLKRNYSEAMRYLDNSIAIAPDWPMAYIYKAWLCLFWKGSITEAKIVLQEASGKADLEQSVYYWWLLRIVESDYEKALNRTYLKSDTTAYYLHIARLYRLSGQLQKQYVYSDSARALLENKIQNQLGNAWFHSQLGLAYAGLGRSSEAIKEGKKAIEIITPSQEAIYALFFIVNLAEIYAITGEYDSAIDQLEFSLSIPGFVSVPYLKLDPVWSVLHDHPRFKQLTEEDK